MPPRTSRLTRALDQLSLAENAVASAQTLLGGRVRTSFPKKKKQEFVARKMLESVSLRLGTIVHLLAFGEEKRAPEAELAHKHIPDPSLHEEQSATAIIALIMEPERGLRASLLQIQLRDTFEQEYDLNREPQC